ncbi:hypothetical protein [Lutibacter sp.]|uniref:hypothetical protein n=1 Tax=Lutibacter sp. TaxID=1925666 RepID=UPI0025C03C3A|nr:hypothetical protein [Lutibacter sp.]MCF6168201.1 hypothetical protein [Lutibacter sp.]
MKKLTSNIFFIVLFLMLFSACKSTKKGCGLTSDAQKIEQPTAHQITVLREV